MKFKKIAHYKIQDKLGEGGMGIVYKAQDTKLNRTVAIKFLPLDRLGGKEEKARFVREAQASAALNHPNIATIYAIDEEDGQTYIAMEYIDGQNLKDMVRSGPLKIKKTLDIVAQIALGLQSAHEQGIIHRDIKSANIMVTSKGQVKIMDFGLAKLTGGSLITKQGTTLGTIAYMSPEQAQGEDVDYRTDIWALGVILYEIVTGQLPFKGDYDQALIYSILNEDPEPLSALRSRVPLELERIVEKCLAKDRNARYQNAVELPVDLKAIDVTSTGSTTKISTATATSLSRMSTMTPAANPKASKFKKILRWSIAFLFFAGVGFSVWKFWLAPSLSPVRRLAIKTDGYLSLEQGSSIAISPDGKNIVYLSKTNDVSRLYLRPLNSFEAMPIQGTEGAGSPFFSPDGQWIGFYADGKIKKASLFGGVPTTLHETHSFLGATWADNDTIYVATRKGGLAKLPANGGTPKSILQSDGNGDSQVICCPSILPGGKAILFTRFPGNSNNPDESSIEILELKSGARRKILDGGIDAAYSPTGHIIASSSGGLLAAPFDLGKLEVTGPTVQILKDVLSTSNHVQNFAFSNEGSLVYVSSAKVKKEHSLVTIDRQGNEQILISRSNEMKWPHISPNGQRLALSMDEKIWLMEIGSKNFVQVPSANNPTHAIWHPNSRTLTFSTNQNGNWTLVSQPVVDLNSPSNQLVGGAHQKRPTSWSADGSTLIYQEADPDSGLDIWVLKAGNAKPQPLLRTAANEQQGVLSPDAKWLAYTSNQSGQNEIYMRTMTGNDNTTQISQGGGASPMWSANGSELYYLVGTKIMAATISTEPQLVIGNPVELFATNGKLDSFSISPQNGRFIFVKESMPQDIGHLNVVLNWFEELNNQVPSGKKWFGLLDWF